MNIKQLKPFNPILGETFQAYWSDGTSIYMEQSSHHPPISHFYLVNQNYTLYGYYEHITKLKSLTGNVFHYNFEGPSNIKFRDGDIISFTYPTTVVSGLMYGKRIVEWQNTMTFLDKKNNVEANLAFTTPPGFFESKKPPTDYFE